MLTRFTRISGNSKTGPIPVTISDKKTCPSTCPHKDKTCYARFGNTNIHWDKVDDFGLEWKAFIESISSLPSQQLWRHNEAGDLYGIGTKIDAKKLVELVWANRRKRGFTYTHKDLLGDNNTAKLNRALVRYANMHGFTINLSADNPDHADQLFDLNIGPVVLIVPTDSAKFFYTPKGRKVNLCPNSYNKKVQCDTCKLCANAERTNIIGLPAHGPCKKRLSLKVRG